MDIEPIIASNSDDDFWRSLQPMIAEDMIVVLEFSEHIQKKQKALNNLHKMILYELDAGVGVVLVNRVYFTHYTGQTLTVPGPSNDDCQRYRRKCLDVIGSWVYTGHTPLVLLISDQWKDSGARPRADVIVSIGGGDSTVKQDAAARVHHVLPDCAHVFALLRRICLEMRRKRATAATVCR